MKDLSLHLLDILQNSISAGATLITTIIDEKSIIGELKLTIIDNGKGMDTEMVQRVTDPFYTTRTTRKVGLGIPLLKQNAERTGGKFSLNSIQNHGTTLEAIFNKNNLDMLPLGDIAGVIAITSTSWPTIDFEYHHLTSEGTFIFDTREIKAALEGVPINDPQIINFLKEMITDNLKEIKAI